MVILWIRVDLHCQSKYTAGADKSMTLDDIVKFAKIKGINMLGTGDCLHPLWRNELKSKLKYEDDVYIYKGIYFIPSVEVKIQTYVHAVILLPTLDDFDELYKLLKPYGKLDKVGVPTINIGGQDLIDILERFDFFIFPAHVFIPWQSLYAKYDSIAEFFKDSERYIQAVELGLSADPPLAHNVPELKCRSFLTNSDFHSPWEIGREFNLISVHNITYSDIIRSIVDNNIINYTLPPKLGKFYFSACRKCHTFFRYEDARILNFRCPICHNKIYIGVHDRILKELAVKQKHYCTTTIKKRRYIHHIPLRYLIRDLLKVSNLEAKKFYIEIINKLKIDEITLLYETPIDELKKYPKLKDVIKKFREKRYYIIPGGGGKEGRISEKPVEITFYKIQQRSIIEFLSGGGVSNGL